MLFVEKGFYVDSFEVKNRLNIDTLRLKTDLKSKDKNKRSTAKLLLSKIKDAFYFRRSRIASCLRKLPHQLQIVYGVEPHITASFIKYYQAYYERTVSREGPGNVLKRLKAIASYCTRIAAGHVADKPPWVRFKQGLPELASPLGKFLKEGTISERQYALTLLYLYRLPVLPGLSPSLDSISRPATITLQEYGEEFMPGKYMQMANNKLKIFDDEYLNDLIRSFRSVLRNLFVIDGSVGHRRKLIQSRARSVHLSLKKGPNGPCIGSIPFDAHAWANSKNLSAQTSLLYLLDKIFNQRADDQQVDIAYRSIINLLNHRSALFKNNEPVDPSSFQLGAIREKIEPGGKVRLFAVIDWFTQSTLRPLHDYIMQLIKSFPGDSSADHNIAANSLFDWLYNNQSEIFSVDLSSATDLIPILSQGEVLSSLWGGIEGQQFAYHWCNLLSNRDFYYNGNLYQYKRGQPMGAYSSWAMLALWHHAIVQTCFHKVNKDRSQLYGLPPLPQQYLIIGDDVVIAHREVYDLYIQIVNGLMGVDISKLKGYTPDTQDTNSPLLALGYSNIAGEVAKRVFTSDGEITPVPPSVWMEGGETAQGFTLLVNELQRRGIVTHWDDAVQLAGWSYRPDLSVLAVSFPWTSAAFSVGWCPDDDVDVRSPWVVVNRLLPFEILCASFVFVLMSKYSRYLDKYMKTKTDSLQLIRKQIVYEFEVRKIKFKSIYLENLITGLYLSPYQNKFYFDQVWEVQQFLKNFKTLWVNDFKDLPETATSKFVLDLWYESFKDKYQIFQLFKELTDKTYDLNDLLNGRPEIEDPRRFSSRMSLEILRETFSLVSSQTEVERYVLG